jgi:hypothetical protein
MVTIIHGERETEVSGARAAGDALWLSRADVTRATRWTVRAEGLCHGDVCVPVPPGREADYVRDAEVDIAGFWRLAGHPVLHDRTGQTWVLGTGALERARALGSLEAPDFTLPDLGGRLHSLSGQRGRKVLLVTWASW